MIGVGDKVKFRGREGWVKEIKRIVLPEPIPNYRLCFVEFDFDCFEWVNDAYLVKVGKIETPQG